MIESLRDILVLSDMDGTLLTDDKRLLASNLETIRLFTMLGGRFTVSTGKTVLAVERYKELLPYLSPAIVSNGTLIYDFSQQATLENISLPRVVARRAVQDIMQKFPHAGVVVMGANGRIYSVKLSPQSQKLFTDELLPYHLCPVDNLPSDWNKVLFAIDPATHSDMQAFVDLQSYPGVQFVSTEPAYFEMMPQGVSKGSALKRLSHILDVPLENTFVIGDYFNDVEIMQTAGHAVAMDNAPPEIKMIAQQTTGSNHEAGVGQFLYELIRQYDK